jgi:hypothetical protein
MLEVRLSGQQAQLRALYELQLQWAESAARAHEAAKLLSPPLPVPSVSARYLELYRQQLHTPLLAEGAAELRALFDAMPASKLAALRLEAERSTEDAKSKKAGEGWFAWANRAKEGQVWDEGGPGPEPAPESLGLSQAAGLAPESELEPERVEPEAEPRSEVPAWHVSMYLPKVSLQLFLDPLLPDDPPPPLAELEVEWLEGKAWQVGVRALELTVGLHNFRVRDDLTPNSQFPLILSPADEWVSGRRRPGSAERSRELLLELRYLQGAGERAAITVRVGAVGRPGLRLVYNGHWVDELLEFVDVIDGTSAAPRRLCSIVRRDSDGVGADMSPRSRGAVGRARALSNLTGVSKSSLSPTLSAPPTGPAAVLAEADVKTRNETRAEYRGQWPRRLGTQTDGADVVLTVHNLLVVVPQAFDICPCVVVALHGRQLSFDSRTQRTEAQDDAYPAKEKLAKRDAARASQGDLLRADGFSCLEAEMPYSTIKLDLCGVDATVAATDADFGAANWPGGLLPGATVVCSTANLELLVMRREPGVRVLCDIPMPRIAVVLQVPSELRLDLPAPALYDAMRVVQGAFLGRWAQENIWRNSTRAPQPKGGLLDTAKLEVQLDFRRIVATVTQTSGRPLVRVTLDDLLLCYSGCYNIADSAEHTGSSEVLVTMGGLAVQDLLTRGGPTTATADTSTIGRFLLKVRQGRSAGGAVEVAYTNTVSADSLAQGLREAHVKFQTRATVNWVPEVVDRVVWMTMTALELLFEEDKGSRSRSNSPTAAQKVRAKAVDDFVVEEKISPGKLSAHRQNARKPRPTAIRLVTTGSADSGSQRALQAFLQDESEEDDGCPGGGEQGVTKFFVEFTDVSLLLEYPEGSQPRAEQLPSAGAANTSFKFNTPFKFPGASAPQAAQTVFVAVVQTKQAQLDFSWDFNAGSYELSLVLGQLAISKTDAECRSDPALSCTDKLKVRYHALLDPTQASARGLGHAYALDLEVPPLRLVCSPASAPLLPELYLYLFASFIVPLNSYNPIPPPDVSLPPECNFLTCSVISTNARVLVTTNPARKGSQYFEATIPELRCSNSLETQQQQGCEPILGFHRPGLQEVYRVAIKDLDVRHPATDTAFVSSLDLEFCQRASFLKQPYAWIHYSLTASDVQIYLPDLIPAHIAHVMRDHLAASSARENHYARFVDTGEVWATDVEVTLPSVSVSVLQNGVRTVLGGTRGVAYTQALEYGHVEQSLRLRELFIDAPHQHILTRVFHAEWVGGDDQRPGFSTKNTHIAPAFLHFERSEFGNMVLAGDVPKVRATLFADSILTSMAIVELMTSGEKREKEKKGPLDLDDIMEEETSGVREDELDAGGNDADFVYKRPVTHTVSLSVGQAEVVVPEKNRTDLLVCRFGFTGEGSGIFDQEFRVACKLGDCSVSMGHWASTRLLGSESRDAELMVDSPLLLDFSLQVEGHSRRKILPNGSVRGQPMKTLLETKVGPIQIVASADQVHLFTAMITHLLDDFKADHEENRAGAIFTANAVVAGFEESEFEDDDGYGGSVRSGTTGRSAVRGSRRSAVSRSDYSDGGMYTETAYSDSDWNTVASESDDGSYAHRSRHSRHSQADSSAGGSDIDSDGGRSESERSYDSRFDQSLQSAPSMSFHSADDDWNHGIDDGRPGGDGTVRSSQYSLPYSLPSSADHTSSGGSGDSDGSKQRRKRRRGKAELSSPFGIIPANIKLRVSCSTMKMTLTSDPFGQVTPLWLLEMTELAFAGRTLPDQILLMSVVMTAHLKYFNVGVLNWESALEPVPTRMDGNWLRGQWTIDVHSVRNMNFNLSEPLLQALDQATEGRKSGPNSSAVEVAPYKFFNLTGQPIVYRIGTDEYTESKALTLQPGQVAEYKVSAAGGTRHRKDRGDFMPRYIKFMLQGTTSERICIDKTASYMLPLHPLTSANTDLAEESSDVNIAKLGAAVTEIYCEVSNGEIKGTRKILFGSPVAVRNATSAIIEVLIEEPQSLAMAERDYEVIQVAPGGLAYVAMRFTRPNSQSKLQIRTTDEYGETSPWSNELNFRRSLHTGRTHREDLVCTYADKHTASFCVSAAIVQNAYHLRTIRLHPKFVLENLLPVSLDYQFIDRNTGRVMATADDDEVGKLVFIMLDEKGEMLANEMSERSFHMESFTEWRLQVKIGDHTQWSEEIQIEEGTQRVDVFDEAEESLQVVFTGKLESQASLRVSVSCPYWIVNKTEDELHTRPWVGPRLGLTRKQKEERRRLQSQIKQLYPDHMVPFSCERGKFSVHVPSFEWSLGIRLNAVGTTDFHLAKDLASYVQLVPEDASTVELELGHGLRETVDAGDGRHGGCHLGVSIQRGSGPLAGTKIFTFTPFFRFDNQTGEDLYIRQRFQERQILLRADMHAMAFEWSDTRSSRRVQVRFAEDDWDWSGGIDIQGHIGEFFIPLTLRRHRHATKYKTRDYIVRGEIKNTEQSTHEAMRMVVFYKEDLKFPPYLMLNACQEDLCIRQLGTDRVVVVQTGLVRPYAFDEPFAPHMIECWIEGDESASLRLIGEQSVDIDVTNVTTASASALSRKMLRVSVDCSGPVTRVRVDVRNQMDERLVGPLMRSLSTTATIPSPNWDSMSKREGERSARSMIDDSPDRKSSAGPLAPGPLGDYMRAPAGPLTGKETSTMRDIRRRMDGLMVGVKDLALEGGGYVSKKGKEIISGFKIAPIAHASGTDLDDRIVLNLGVRFNSVRVSLIGVVETTTQPAELDSIADIRQMQSGRSEILLLALDKVRIKVETDDTQQRAELCVGYLQVDNQSHKNKYPVLLSITPDKETDDCVVIHVDRAEFNDRIQYFDYAAVQISDLMHIQIEEQWVVSTASFLNRWKERVMGSGNSEKNAEKAQMDSSVDPEGPSGLSVFFGMRGEQTSELPQRKNLYFDILRLEPVHILLDVSTNSGDDNLMLGLPDMNNLRMRFNELQLKSPYGSADSILRELLQNYRRQFLRKLYKVVGSVLKNGVVYTFLSSILRGLYEVVHLPVINARQDLELLRKLHLIRYVRAMGPTQGLIVGVVMFVSNTVEAVCEAVAWGLSTVAALIARGSADRKFIVRRRNLMRSKPRHIFDGVLLAVLVIMTVRSSILSCNPMQTDPFILIVLRGCL